MRIYPSQEFWESSLETPVFSLLSDFRNQNIRKNWLHSISGKQLSVIFYYCCKDKQNGQLFEHNIPWQYDDVSVQQKRKILTNIYDTLFDCYLVDRFGCTKSESAIVEVAKSVLHQDIIESLLLQNNKYDKKSLLFILFHDDPHLLKHVFHFNKVQKRSFSSFTLKNPPRQKTATFKDFVSKEKVQQILKQHDLTENDNFESQFQGFFFYQNRIYVFIRRARDLDLILNSNQVVHGYKPDWIIIDFALNANQVNLCTKSISQGLRITNYIVSQYFERECSFINTHNQTEVAQVYKFLQACIEGADADICIFEIKFRSAYFRAIAYPTII
ncbi:MAG: hypothetical protein sGL2_09420 [Candidatus Mesenet longicola]|nr:MAG: hypothetical protein sGL2_09420 [Candidatus Mesenet longicola]